MGALKLTNSELKILTLLSKRDEIGMTELRELGFSPSRISQVMKSLKLKKLVKDTRRGISKYVSLSEAKHAALFRRVTLEYEHMDLNALLSGSNLEVLSAISCLHLKSRREICEKTLVSEYTIAKILKKLRELGVIVKDSIYYISPRFQTLKEFVTEFRHNLNLDIAQEVSTDSLIIWECNHEFIIECKDEKSIEGFLPTGISAFWRYGVQLFVSKWHYLHSPFIKEITLEDAIIHAILSNAENIIPTLLVWKKNEDKLDLKKLEKEARKYGILEKTRKIFHYIKTQGTETAPGFPTWNEFVTKAEGYGAI